MRPAQLAAAVRAFALACLVITQPLPSRAQLSDPDKFVFHFTVFTPRPAAGLAFIPSENATPEPIKFYPTARSPDYEYRGAMPVRFLEVSTGEVVATATIPPDMPRALLLFLAADEGKSGSTSRYQVLVLDDSALRLGPRGLAVVNVSGLPLTGAINNRRIVLTSGLNPTFPTGDSANIVLETSFQNRRYRAFGDTIALAPGERALLMLFPPFYRGSLEVQGRMLVDEAPPIEPLKTPSKK